MTRKRTAKQKTIAIPASKGRTAYRAAKPTEISKPARMAGPKTSTATKLQACLTLLGRKHGATLKDLMAVTGWKAHSVRGFLSGTVKKKLGLPVESTKDENGVRHYLLDRQSEAA